ncbi:MAG TPA: efflux RND transporter periplasmic adaptor subunit [Verrucomicrobiae bacterium]|jgi:membrane fusion protein (multidrug efflux system)|nr:efflux RND transporter periplasmic adaptor subunit [Verrucomicrobiae bacterium]
MKRTFSKPGIHASAVVLVSLLATGCNRAPAGAGFTMPPPLVNTVTVKTRDLPVTTQLPGRVDAERIANVNARVEGVVLRREFDQGAEVTNGQVLYQIDPAPYQAQLDSAQANLTQAQALMDRYKPLVRINAVSRQNYDNAVAAAAQAKAAKEIAAINLGYCSVAAPISGRIGPALVTEGTLVSQSAATPMAVVQQMDPIYFDFTQASVEVLKLRDELQSGKLKSPEGTELKVTLQLPDGSTYPHAGKLLFQDVSVDPSSGMVTLRAEFSNPDHVLLPGMFAVGTVDEGISPGTILVPQRAVVLGPAGGATVMLVTTTNSVEPQPIELGAANGTNWVVQSGLKAGDRVIVDGLQKAQPGATVNPVDVDSTNAPAAGH